MNQDNEVTLVLQWRRGLSLERGYASGIRQLRTRGIHGCQRIKQSCGAEIGEELGDSWVLRLQPGIGSETRVTGNVKIEGVLSSSQGTPDPVGAG